MTGLLYRAFRGQVWRVFYDETLVDPMTDAEAQALLQRWQAREQSCVDRDAIEASTIAGNIAREIAEAITEARAQQQQMETVGSCL